MLFIPFLEVVLHTYINNHTEDDLDDKIKEEEKDEDAKNAFKAEMAKKLGQITEVELRFTAVFVHLLYNIATNEWPSFFSISQKAIVRPPIW